VTRSERREAAESRRNQFKDMFIKCFFSTKREKRDVIAAWDEIEIYCHRIVSKEPQNAELIRSALCRAKEYIRSYNLKANSRPVAGCLLSGKKPVCATSLAVALTQEEENA
jgi:hypothetical protein